jgi:uncharacterized protein (TIGR02302 family)
LGLPERVFEHPVARAIIDQRKELVTDPGARLAVADTLGDLRERPRLYRDDTVAFLALRLAEQRLRINDDANSIAEVQQLLWDTALRIEDGRMSLAERRLQQELQDALAKNAPDEEIERLMKELQQALDRYLQALAENMARNPDQAQQPIDPSKVISSRDLQRMLDRARDLARNGGRDQARELLSQLQNMLENLRMARPGQMPQQGSSEGQQMMRGMREMMQRQQQLLDRSFRAQQQQQGQQGQPGRTGQRGQQPGGDQQDPNAQMGDAAGQQEGLRRTLGEMMRRLGDGLGDIPDPLGRAERAMRWTNCNRRPAILPSRCSGVCKANGATRGMTRSAPPTDCRAIGSSAIRSVGRCRTTAPMIRVTLKSPTRIPCRKRVRSWTNCAAAPASASVLKSSSTTSTGC